MQNSWFCIDTSKFGEDGTCLAQIDIAITLSLTTNGENVDNSINDKRRPLQISNVGQTFFFDTGLMAYRMRVDRKQPKRTARTLENANVT